MASLATSSVVVLSLLSCCCMQTMARVAIMSSGVSYSSCSYSSVFEVKGLIVTPDPPQVGKSVTLQAIIESSEVVTGGQVTVQVKGTGSLSFLQVPATTYDLCSLLPDGCPISRGTTSLTVTKDVPSIVPPGTYEVEIKAYDNSGKTLLCSDVTIQLTTGRHMFFF